MGGIAGPDADRSRGERRRLAMIEAATAAFLAHGYAGASLDMVIERSGGSRRTLYEQFGNKEGLFAVVVETLPARLFALPGIDAPEEDPEADLVRLGRAVVSVLLDEACLDACRMVMAERRRFPELGARFLATGPDRLHAAVAARLATHAGAGRLAIDDADAAARRLVGAMAGEAVLRALLDGRDRPDEAAIEGRVRAAVATFLHGTARREA
jgi:AcrR family transcriptional regulator